MFYHPNLISNQVSYTFGLKIEIVQLPQQQSIPIAKGSTIDKFIGFFPTADTDFGIQIDNTGNDRRISFNLKGTKDFGSFVVGAGRKALLKTVTDNGRHFHFTSQSGEKGKEVVAANAARSNITYEESSEICSRLVFDVAIEESKFTVTVITTTSKEIEFKVSSNDTFETLMLLIEAKEGIPQDQQRFIFKGKHCEGGRTMKDYNIQAGSTIHMVLRLRGGAVCFNSVRGANDGTQSVMADASSAIEVSVNQISASTSHEDGDIERGAICFGQKTTQTFTKCRNFNKSDVDNVKPFTLELFFNPNMYSLDP
ncbi:unnamed protein product [Brassicogethes aeneus]|uniref:Ubiquitin-like domain-containing protein n=1 Tax=Brassicogethes aeneus TaxID=1431903 RepID=A0A9P0AX67_BRAAE|nr:unnamed protein product [Brassicogethes aeneus]